MSNANPAAGTGLSRRDRREVMVAALVATIPANLSVVRRAGAEQAYEALSPDTLERLYAALPAGPTANDGRRDDDSTLDMPDPADLNGVAVFRPRR